MIKRLPTKKARLLSYIGVYTLMFVLSFILLTGIWVIIRILFLSSVEFYRDYGEKFLVNLLLSLIVISLFVAMMLTIKFYAKKRIITVDFADKLLLFYIAFCGIFLIYETVIILLRRLRLLFDETSVFWLVLIIVSFISMKLLLRIAEKQEEWRIVADDTQKEIGSGTEDELVCESPESDVKMVEETPVTSKTGVISRLRCNLLLSSLTGGVLSLITARLFMSNVTAVIAFILGIGTVIESIVLIKKYRKMITIPGAIAGVFGIMLSVFIFLSSISHGEITSVTIIQNRLYSTQICTLDLDTFGIGDRDVRAMAHMTNLEELYLNNNNISDISPLSNLTNLEKLWIWNNNIQDITSLENLTNLKSLVLSDNQISDISPLNGLDNLIVLDLNNNQISDISPLTGLNELLTLDLNDNQIIDISALSNNGRLIHLFLEDNQISDISVLAEITKLSLLFLRNNPIEDISPLFSLSELSTLDLTGTLVSYKQIIELQNMLPECKIILD